jgi:acetyl-CoA synthetase
MADAAAPVESSAKRVKLATDERDEVHSIEPAPRVRDGAHITSMHAFEAMYTASMADPETFWGEQGRRFVSWFTPFTKASGGSFVDGDIRWYSGA